MAMEQVSFDSPCRLRPEWNSACVMKGGDHTDRFVPGLCTIHPLPVFPLGLKDVLCVCACMNIALWDLLGSQGFDGDSLLTHEEAQLLDTGLM